MKKDFIQRERKPLCKKKAIKKPQKNLAFKEFQSLSERQKLIFKRLCDYLNLINITFSFHLLFVLFWAEVLSWFYKPVNTIMDMWGWSPVDISLLWWELGTNSLITGPGEWLSFRRFTSKLSWSWSWPILSAHSFASIVQFWPLNDQRLEESSL